MKKNIQILVGVVLVSLLVFGSIGCEKESGNPVVPVNSAPEVVHYYRTGPSGEEVEGSYNVYARQPASTCDPNTGSDNGEIIVEFNDDNVHTLVATFANGSSWTYTIQGKGVHHLGTLCESGEILSLVELM